MEMEVFGYPVIQEHHYYPLGMEFEGPWAIHPQRENAYLYNGKELNEDLELDWLDYGARWYDPAIGRWNAVDPLAEKYAPYSPYNYVLGNPIRFTDPDGMQVEDDFIYNKQGELIQRIETDEPDRFLILEGYNVDSDMVPTPQYSEVDMDSDLGHMARTVYAEGAGQSDEAKLALAEVIKTRAEDDTKPSDSNNYNAQFSDVSTYEEVVTQSGQFESVGKGAKRYTSPLSVTGGDGPGGSKRNEQETSAFAASVGASIKVHNQGSNTAQGATNFFSPYIPTPGWAKTMTPISVKGVSSKDFRFYKY